VRVERDSGMCVARDLYELWGRSPYTRMFIPSHLNRPQHSLQNHYDQQPDSRHYAANDDRARGHSCSAFHYSKRSE
jgi:hypothetical protein